MELPKTFDPSGLDARWYAQWMQHRLFASVPDEREPYVVVIPPPNVTGVLHMGHCLNNTVQDVLVRRAHMLGYNVCWVPGTDHASIATEAKVVQMLRERGINKSQLSREEFLKYAWEWKEQYGGIILQQLQKLCCALDWNRVTFTMDADYYSSVIKVFIQLYRQGLIYRGLRMIHWDPQALTALSDEEVFYREVQGKLYHVRYRLDGVSDEGIVIATVRPETILGDTAICVHPDDDRYRHLIGTHAFVPLVNRRIPILADDYVDRSFGTGVLKVTPAHDMNDYQLGLKHGLEAVEVIGADGCMTAAAGAYAGMDRFAARKKIVADLEQQGLIVKVGDYTHKVGYSERSHAVVEPRLSQQWWVRMTELARPALAAVERGDIKFFPDRFVNLYRHWMEHIRDWCISRQLWWGHRIPAWYLPDGTVAVAEHADEAWQQLEEHARRSGFSRNDLKQDDDVLDTWFSSWLWPLEVFHGISRPGNEEFRYYYPTHALVTAPEIIFFWVARMIMAGYAFAGERPFREVYFTGIVRDKIGRKMSKSLGNSPDLLELLDRYGADAVRFGILISSPAGNDLLFDEKLIEQGRNFNNKIWNALRLVKGWQPAEDGTDRLTWLQNRRAVQWFERRLQRYLHFCQSAYAAYDLYEVLKQTYSLIWEDFCSWYLEMVKPVGTHIVDRYAYSQTITFFEQLMQVLHPFMPCITEEVYRLLQPRQEGEFLLRTQWPRAADSVEEDEEDALLVRLVTALRDHRNRHQIKPRERLPVYLDASLSEGAQALVQKLAHADLFRREQAPPQATVLLVGTLEVRVGSSTPTNAEEERQRLLEELNYTRGFLEVTRKKLSNEKFLAHAREEVVARERSKARDAEEKIRLLTARLEALSAGG
ncbi:MAG: valine--tRNA ligase [Chitinophagales bacterium]|nr:valine--tRNA ligase [Chitinophagales bacterium]MDW8393326.1 valine--tRNA ligase [Chitinophagales bacterium]